jgi:HEAT repeat protein
MSYRNIIIDLDSPDESVRMGAVLSLSKNVDMRAVSALMKVCKTDESLEVRFCAKKALSLYRDRLVKSRGEQNTCAANSDANDSVTKVAAANTSAANHTSANARAVNSTQAKAVGFPTGQVAGGVVAPSNEVDRHVIFLKSEDPKLRVKAIMALVQLRDPHIVKHFRELFSTETNSKVKSALLIAFGLLRDNQDLPLLFTALSDPSLSIRSSALEAIRQSKSITAVPHLLLLLRGDDKKMRELSANVLADFPIEVVLSEIRRLMSSYEVDDRDVAVYGLLKLQRTESLPLLIGAMADEAMSVRLKARNALVNLARSGFKAAEDALAAHMGETRSSPDAFLTMSVIEAIPVLDGLNAVVARDRLAAIRKIVENNQVEKSPSVLNALVREKDPYVRSALILALGRLKAEDSVSTLKIFIQDKDDRIRANTVEALGLIGGADIFPLLIPCLDDKNNRVLANAILALSTCPYIQLDGPLKKMFVSEEILMRRSLIYALVELRNPSYFSILEKLLDDKEDLVNKMAYDALKLLASEGLPGAIDIVAKRGL